MNEKENDTIQKIMNMMGIFTEEIIKLEENHKWKSENEV